MNGSFANIHIIILAVLLDLSNIAKDRQLHCKTCPFSVQKMTFWVVKGHVLYPI